MKQKLTGYIEIISAVTIWAIASGVIVRWINQSAEIVYGVGALVGFLFILAWIIATKKYEKIEESFPWKKNLALIGLFIGLNNGLFYIAIKTTTVANAVLTHYFEPILFVMIFAPLVLKQKIQKGHLIASLIGFAGLLAILGPQINVTKVDIGIVLGLASAVFFAWHTAIESKLANTTSINPLVEVLYKNGVPALMFLPFVLSKSINESISSVDYLKLILFGIIVLGISFVLLYRGLAKVSGQSASVMFYIEPIGAVFLAWIVWGEALTASTIIGGAMILIAGYLAVRNK